MRGAAARGRLDSEDHGVAGEPTAATPAPVGDVDATFRTVDVESKQKSSGTHPVRKWTSRV